MNKSLMNLKYLAVLLLAVVFIFLVSFDAFSQSEIIIGNDGDTAVLQTSKSITREVVSYEPYESTCSREVPSGSRTVCSPGRTENRCRKVAGVGDECWEVTTGGECNEETVYETEYYSCTRSRRIVEDVHDHSVHATINVIKTLRSKNYDLNKCKFGVSLSDASENYYAVCQEAIVKHLVVKRKEEMNGKDKIRVINLDLDFFSITEINALKNGINELAHSNGVVSFVTSDLEGQSNFKMTLKLTRNRLLLKDKVVFNKSLEAGDYSMVKLSSGLARINVNLAKIGASIDSTKKHTLNIGMATIKAVDVKGALNTPKLENALNASFIIND